MAFPQGAVARADPPTATKLGNRLTFHARPRCSSCCWSQLPHPPACSPRLSSALCSSDFQTPPSSSCMFGTMHLDISCSLLLHRVTVNFLAAPLSYPAKPVRQVHGQRRVTIPLLSGFLATSPLQRLSSPTVGTSAILAANQQQSTSVPGCPASLQLLAKKFGTSARPPPLTPSLLPSLPLRDQGKGALLCVETVRHLGH